MLRLRTTVEVATILQRSGLPVSVDMLKKYPRDKRYRKPSTPSWTEEEITEAWYHFRHKTVARFPYLHFTTPNFKDC